MKLNIVTPLSVVVESDIRSLRAEDKSGSFGILTGHADFLTSLTVSVVSWTTLTGTAGYCAVRGGVLTVTIQPGGRPVRHRRSAGRPPDPLSIFIYPVTADRRRHFRAGWSSG